MAIKLAEHTNGNHIYMRMCLDNGRTEEIDVYLGKYCFLDCNANADNIMDAAAYMIWNNANCKEPDWTKSEYIKPEQKEKCRQNILAIAKMANLMTKEEVENFINYDYLGDMESIPF